MERIQFLILFKNSNKRAKINKKMLLNHLNNTNK